MPNPLGFESQVPQHHAGHTDSVHPRHLEDDLAIQLYVQLLMTSFFEDISICVTVVLHGVSNRSSGYLP